ncbi:MAG: glycosyltransferase [Opitutaceae bacterium]|nr:glycosyltransferase [Opitutaceae bacterium]
MKPGYLLFYLRSRAWIKRALKRGQQFDLIHQINPLAMRYPCPAAGLRQKLILGPLAGSLPTPPGFRKTSTDAVWFRKLRNLDRVRLRYDPWLHRGYAEAEMILGVAPYVETFLNEVRPKRFEVEGETGVESISEPPEKKVDGCSPLKLLYVGRIIRTKGLIDAIKALSLLDKSVRFKLDVIGEGDMSNECVELARTTGIAENICFHGRLPKSRLESFYRAADLFLFPSFREPSGNVVFEALGNGLPVVTTECGGPGYVVNETCGIRVNASDPESLIAGLKNALEYIGRNRQVLSGWAKGATLRMAHLSLWDVKTERMLNRYVQLAKQ